MGGSTFEYFLKEKLSLGAELFYSPNGFSFDRNYQTSQSVNYQFRYNYLSVPLKIRYNLINMFEKRGHIFIKTGIAPSYLLRAKVKTTVYSENNEIIDKNEVIFNDNITKFDFAGLGEIGLSTKTSEKFVIYLSVMHKRSFNSFSTDEFFPDNQLKHNSFHIIWGLNFL
ncbi:outer membrane beta-barrel protein [Chondrinema litorale]|uniref:outer membrane beta-barrel protein n=1 Tax=Chondrinema litorale TaxID=2994555 RepID=UPI0025432D27|nr:outer membrane beta-barrel protein [Chondrinema litorale]UZR97058.1 outer membrane beta-barrel protein [Chondrinema litorale]